MALDVGERNHSWQMSQVMLHHRMEDIYQHFAHRFTLNLASTIMIYRVNLLHMFCHSWSNCPTRLKHRPIPRTMGCTRPWQMSGIEEVRGLLHRGALQHRITKLLRVHCMRDRRAAMVLSSSAVASFQTFPELVWRKICRKLPLFSGQSHGFLYFVPLNPSIWNIDSQKKKKGMLDPGSKST